MFRDIIYFTGAIIFCVFCCVVYMIMTDWAVYVCMRGTQNSTYGECVWQQNTRAHMIMIILYAKILIRYFLVFKFCMFSPVFIFIQCVICLFQNEAVGHVLWRLWGSHRCWLHDPFTLYDWLAILNSPCQITISQWLELDVGKQLKEKHE